MSKTEPIDELGWDVTVFNAEKYKEQLTVV